jgi:hypothetical protein
MAVAAEQIDSLPRQLAAQVTVARRRFQEIYDELWREVQANDPAKVYSGEYFLSAVLGEDGTPPVNDVEAFTRAFAVAFAGYWLKLLVDRCVRRMAIHPSALALIRPAPVPVRAAGETTLLEAAINQLAGFTDPMALASGLQRTMPKICRINVDGQSSGTGFLVGTQTVITAWHVIAPLLNDDGTPQTDSHQRLSVEFDFLDPVDGGSAKGNITRYDVVERWLQENSACCACEMPAQRRGIPHELQDGSIDATRLDFAVIRLQGSPGRNRGMVKLSSKPIRVAPGMRMKVAVFQHPRQFPLRMAEGRLTGFVGTGEPRPRFRHRANTDSGSSGGLCVDSRFECVGLHQAAVVNARGKPVANQAVPTALIASQLVAAYQVDPAHDPLFQLKGTHEPVIGREAFQESVWRAHRGDKRIIMVRGQRRSGLSFSEKILRSVLPQTDTLIAKLTADQVGRDAASLAERLLARCGGQLGGGEKFPARSDAGTAPDAWLRDQLIPALLLRIKAAALGKQVWIVLDDLDRHDIPEDDALYLLIGLMKATTEASFVRFLLIGLDKVPATVPRQLAEADVTGWPLGADVEDYIQRYCTLKNIPMDTPERQRLRDSVLRAATRDAKALADQWIAAVSFLEENLHPVKGRADG